MSLQTAAETLLTDLRSLQARAIEAGWPVRARILSTGVSGRRDHRDKRNGGAVGTGIFARFNADGEDYVFTITGNAPGIERLIQRSHDAASAALARHWPQHEAVVVPVDLETDDHGPVTLSGYDEQEADPRPRRRRERDITHRHTFSIQRRPDGLWSACVCVPTPGGPLYLCATADEHAVAQALQTELSVTRNPSIASGLDFRAACGAVAEARAMDRVGSALKQMTRDPGVQSIFQNIVPMIPFVGPPAALAFQGARAAIAITDKVNAGDPKATAAVKAVADRAKKGDKRAERAIMALREAQILKETERLTVENKRLISDNDMLRLKIAAMEKKWEDKPLDAADDFVDMWGGSDEFVGPDIVQAAGNLIGAAVEASGAGQLARPIVASYYAKRMPVGGNIRRDSSPEVGALYHRPMRESSTASARKDYLRGTALQTQGFAQGRHFLAPWETPATPVTSR